MVQQDYTASRAFVREIRHLAAGRDLLFIHRAVLQMRDWLEKHSNDRVVGTALEEFDILKEAALIVEQQTKASSLAGAVG